jgi:hypothetical protein
MKKLGFLAVVIAACLLSSCTQDNQPTDNTKPIVDPSVKGLSVGPDKRVEFAGGNLTFRRFPGTIVVDSFYIKVTKTKVSKPRDPAVYDYTFTVDSVNKIDNPLVISHEIKFTVDSMFLTNDKGEPKSGWVDSVWVAAEGGLIDEMQISAVFEQWQLAQNQQTSYGETYPAQNLEGTEFVVDMFAWSNGVRTNAKGVELARFGMTKSTVDSLYTGAFVDWGALPIDDYEPNTWRTLTSDEWGYLRWSRPRATELCGVAQVNGVNGLVLLPDNWQNTAEITFVPGFDVNYGAQYFAVHQTFTAEQWAVMEAAGAVFLPAAGFTDSDLTTITNPSYFGRYWSATPGVCFEFYSREAGRKANDLTRAISVRLVKDVQ